MKTALRQVSYLADHQDFIPILARWFIEEWRDFYYGKRWEDVAAVFRTRLSRTGVPLALVAREGDEPLGTLSLVEESIATHRHLKPWLGGLFVTPPCRHQGVATALIERAVEEASRMKIETINIAISKSESFYRQRGWKTIDKVLLHDESITIMRLDLKQAPSQH